MTIFELVKIALDELYLQGRARYGSEVDGVIKARMKYLSESYANLNDPERETIDYKDPATRFAYVFKYVAAHGDYMVQLLERLREELSDRVFTTETVRISCIGGGPGSDIIAVLKYLEEQERREGVKKVICYLLDKEQAWADTWTELDDSFDVGVRLNANFQPLDVTDQGSWSFQRKFLQADVFTMSYFASEVQHLEEDGELANFWSLLFDEAKPGAFFLYIDNGHEVFNEYFDAQWEDKDLEPLLADDNARWTPRYSEQASDLGEYLDKFGQYPKLQARLTYRVLRKK